MGLCQSIHNVYGGKGDGVPAVTCEVGEGDVIELGSSRIEVWWLCLDCQSTLAETCVLKVLYTPCHTPGHVCYFVPEQVRIPAYRTLLYFIYTTFIITDVYQASVATPIVFTGDTLFVGGAGNLNAGTPAQMLDAMQRLAKLPGNTEVYAGHEYTCRNLQWGCDYEPENEHIKSKYARMQTTKCSMPSSIGEELHTNPCESIRIIFKLC